MKIIVSTILILLALVMLASCANKQRRHPAGEGAENTSPPILSLVQEKVYYDSAFVNAFTAASAMLGQKTKISGNLATQKIHFNHLNTLAQKMIQEISTYLPFVKDRKTHASLMGLLAKMQGLDTRGFGDENYWTNKIYLQQKAFKKINTEFSVLAKSLKLRDRKPINADQMILLELKIIANILAVDPAASGDLFYWMHTNKMNKSHLHQLKVILQEKINFLSSVEAKETFNKMIQELDTTYNNPSTQDLPSQSKTSVRINKALAGVKERLDALFLKIANGKSMDLGTIYREKLITSFEQLGRRKERVTPSMIDNIMKTMQLNNITMRELLETQNDDLKKGIFVVLLAGNFMEDLTKNIDFFGHFLDSKIPYFTDKLMQIIQENYLEPKSFDKKLLTIIMQSSTARTDLFDLYRARAEGPIEHQDLLTKLILHSSKQVRTFAKEQILPIAEQLSPENLEKLLETLKNNHPLNIAALQVLTANKYPEPLIKVYQEAFLLPVQAITRQRALISLSHIKPNDIFPILIQELHATNKKTDAINIIKILESFQSGTSFSPRFNRLSSTYFLSRKTSRPVKMAALFALAKVNNNTSKKVNDQLIKIFIESLTQEKNKLNLAVFKLLAHSTHLNRSYLKEILKLQKLINKKKYKQVEGALDILTINSRVSMLISEFNKKLPAQGICKKIYHFFK